MRLIVYRSCGLVAGRSGMSAPAYVKKSRSDATFLRIVASPQAQCLPCSEAVAYDRTVMLDLKGDEDSDVLARMKKRGRCDVRKALREID